MPKSAAEYEKEFLSGLRTSSGADLKTWMKRCKESGETKHNAVLKFLKSNYEFNHMQANFLAAIFLNGGQAVYGNTSDLMGQHFKNKESVRPLYDKLETWVKSQFKTVAVVPTKGYVSFRAEREFAVAKITKTGIRVGMDLGERPFDKKVAKAKSLGAMPRMSHMVEISVAREIDASLKTLLKEANTRVNG